MQPYTLTRRSMARLARLGLILALIATMGVWPAAPAAARTMEADGPAPAAEPAAAAPALLQFTSGQHVVGFGPTQVVVAGLDHALRIEFAGAAGVTPKATGAPATASSQGAQPLGVVTYDDLWPGITVEYRAAADSGLQSMYQLAPGADAGQIRLRYNAPVEVQSDGSLRISFENGDISEPAPEAWQEIAGQRVPVQAAFTLRSAPRSPAGRGDKDAGAGAEVGLRLGRYNSQSPVNVSSTTRWFSIYGTNPDSAWSCPATSADGYSIAVDGDGNVYVAGMSECEWYHNQPAALPSPLHPHSVNPNNYNQSSANLFVLKLNSSGGYMWHTFYGAEQGQAWGYGVALDGNSNIYVTGYSSFGGWLGDNNQQPINAFSGSMGLFVLKLNNNGGYQWHTFYPGVGHGIAVDGVGNILVSGAISTATGTNWGHSPLHACPTPNSSCVIVLKLNASGAYQWHTFYAGSLTNGISVGRNLAVDGNNNIYVADTSTATWQGDNGANPLHPYDSGVTYNAEVIKLDSSGAYQWHTFYGADGWNFGVAVDSGSDVYVTGVTATGWLGDNNTAPLHAFPGSSSTDTLFGLKLNSSGAYQWHTFYGSFVRHPAVTTSGGNVYLLGTTTNQFFGDNNASPVQPFQCSDYCSFLLSLNTSGVYQYHGFWGLNTTEGYDVAGDASGNIRGVGSTTACGVLSWGSPPLSPLNYGACNGGYGNALVTSNVINPPAPPTILTGVVTDRVTGQIIAGATVTVTDSAGHIYTTTTDANGVYTFTGTTANPLAAGSATVQASSVAGYGSDSQTTTIVAGTTNTQNLTLPPLLVISKTAQDVNGAPLYVGDDIIYTVVVTAGAAQTGVVINDAIPANTTYVVGSASVSQGSVSGPDPLAANVGAMAAGQTAQLSFRVRPASVPPGLWSALGTGVNGTVDAVAVSGSDVYVGGDFTSAGGVPASNIAKWNATTTSWSALGTGITGLVVDALAVSGSDVYVGGYFTSAGGVPASNIAKWNATTTSWSALGAGATDQVFAIAVSGSDVYVGGLFTSAGGVTANRIAKWNGSWSALGTGVDIRVRALAISGSDVYVGGNFTSAGGVAASNIAKWNTTTTSWSALGAGTTGQVMALAVSGSDVYVGGLFTNAGGGAANYIAKWNVTTTGWSALGAGVDSYVIALAPSGGNVYVGGWFTSAGGVSANRIARYDPGAITNQAQVSSDQKPTPVLSDPVQLGPVNPATGASISGQVRNDVDTDGDPTDVESGISGVAIRLYADDGTGKPTGAALATTTTDGSGNYTFTNVAAGSYVIVETNPAGYSSTYDKDGAANNTLDQIAVVLSGANSTGNDFLDAPATILTGVVTDRVTGQIIAGATVTVTDSAGHIYTTTTDANGVYTFTSTVVHPLAAGSATVQAGSVAGYGSDSQVKTIVAGVTNTQNLTLPPTAATAVTITSLRATSPRFDWMAWFADLLQRWLQRLLR